MSNKDIGEWLNNEKSPSPATLSLGHGNFCLIHRVVAILESGSLPMKRLRDKALESNNLIDATAGRKTRSIVITDSKHVILSALAPHTLHERMVEEEKH